MHRGQAVQHALHAVGECVVGQIHIGKQRITPEIRDLASIKDRASEAERPRIDPVADREHFRCNPRCSPAKAAKFRC